MWKLDFEFDETAYLCRLKLLSFVDDHAREALAIDTDRSTGGDDVVAMLERLVAGHRAPEYTRIDNDPELIIWIRRDWCACRDSARPTPNQHCRRSILE